MATPVNANINVVVNTSQAVSQLRSLQAQVAATNKGLAASSGAAVAQQAALNKALMDSANASRMWNARMVPMSTATQQFSNALDKGKLSLSQYTRHAASQLPGMSRVFKREFDMMSRVAEQNVRRMQTQYVALGNSANGAAQAMALTPTHLNKMAAASQIATQRQVLMNRMIDLGSTKLLNWGKNTQWAGRQLMVGFSIPLAMLGAVAAKTFKEIDQSTISFKRVYGNLQTTTAEMERNLDAVKELGIEYTKYGKSLSSTIELSAKVAATGAQDQTLLAATEQTMRLATLGLMEYDEALEATIALQTAFKVSNEDLTSTIDFLNVVENETILTMQDMAAAIPRVAPVVKGLGGDVKDLAVFMTAMREGGVSAEQGANALKSGLGRLINPTKAAREEMAKYGISIDAITQKNKGDLMGTLQDFGDALATLGDFEQQQVLQKVFGTYQYARLGALFKNLSNDSGQAQRTIELTAMSVEDLAKISEKELLKIEEATSTRFAAAVEKLKISIAPLGETFMKALMPVIDFVTKIANSFNDLPEGIKNAIAIVVATVAGVGPIVLMTVGLIANGIANITKLIQVIRKFFARLKGDSSAFQHLTAEEQEAKLAADGLSGSAERLTAKFVGQRKALESLVGMLGAYSKALSSTAMAAPIMMGMPGVPRGGGRSVVSGPQSRTVVSRGYNKGVVGVPGFGNKDTIPALLTPGESVVTKEASKKYAPIISAMNAGTIKGFNNGVTGYTNQVVPMTAAANLSKTFTSAPSAEQMGAGVAAGFARGFTKTAAKGLTLVQTEIAVAEAAYKRLTPVMNQFYNNFQAEVDQTIRATGRATLNEQELEQARLRAAKTTADAMRAQEAATGRRALSGPLRNAALQFMGAPGYTAPITTLSRTGAGHADPLGRASLMGVKALRSMENPTTRERFGVGYKGWGRGLSGWAARTAGISGPMHWGHLSSPKGIPLSAAEQMASRTGASATAPKIVDAVRAGAATTAAALRTGANTELGISSPSRVAENTMRQYVDGVQTGTKQNIPRVTTSGKLIGQTFDQAVKAAILSGGPVPPPPMPPTRGGSAAAGAPGPESDAARQARLIKEQILSAKPQIKTNGQELKKNVSGIFKEIGNIFRVLPQGAYEIARNFKESGRIIGSIISQIAAPYVKPIVDGFKFLKDTIVINTKLAAALVVNDIKKIPGILKGAATAIATKVSTALSNAGDIFKNAYTMAALRASVAMDSVKAIPAKIKSSYETAALRLMMGLDSIKKFPDTVKKQIAGLQSRFATFREDLSNQARRLANRAFYGQQDVRGRMSQAFAGIRERFGASAGASVAALRERDPRTAARAFVPDATAAQVKTMSEQISKAAVNVKARLTEAATNVANSARLARVLLREGDFRGAMRAITPDKIAQAFSAATKPIMNASKIAYDQLVNGAKFIDGKVRNVADIVNKKISSAAEKLSAVGSKLANSLQVAGQALAMRDPKTALRALTPDRVAAALGSARTRAGEIYGTAKATGITAYNALLARDIKTFIKALTPDKVWAAGSKLATSISNVAKQVGTAGKFAYDTIIFNAKAAIALGPGIVKDGFNYVRSSLISGANFIKDTIVTNVRAALVVGSSEIKKAFSTAKTFITQGGKFIFDTVKINIGTAMYLVKNEISRIGTILKTEGPKLKESLSGAAKGIAGAIKGAGGILADSIRSVGGLVKAAGIGAAQGVRGFLEGGVNAKGQTRGQRIAGAGNNAMMGLMGLSMAASFAGGEVGEMAQKIMPVTMGLMGLQMILPLLASPLGIAIIGITALGAAFVKARMDIDSLARESARAGANIGGLADGMKIIEEATGFSVKSTGDRLFRFSEKDRKAMGEFSSYFESEGGSKFIEELKNSTSEERYQKVSALLAQAIASGLEKEKAQAFGNAIAEATGDALLKSSIARDFANQIFGSGARTLIDLEKERMASAPNIPSSPELGVNTKVGGLLGGGGGMGDVQRVRQVGTTIGAVAGAIIAAKTGAAVGTTLGTAVPGIGNAVGLAIGAGLGAAIGFGGTYFATKRDEAEIAKSTEEAAKSLGFVLQSIKNISNAEAVLEQQRIDGTVSIQEYFDQQKDLNILQEQSSEYLAQTFAAGADQGAMLQALGDQLSFADFDEDKIKRITTVFNPDALATRFFGEGEDITFANLDKAQQKYVQDVFGKVMSGLTPDNVAQRLQDVETTYTDIAESTVKAITNGATEGIDFFFNKQNIEDYINQRMGGAAGKGMSYNVSALSANILQVDNDLKRIGTDSMETFTRLSEFIDQDFAKKIMSNKKDIVEFGKIVAKLSEYQDISLEVTMEKGIDPDKIINSIQKINEIKLDKDIFGSATLDADSLTQAMIDAGVAIEKIPQKVAERVSEAEKKVASLADSAKNELGNIKINANIAMSLFGVERTDSQGLVNALDSAFPEGISPIQVPLLLSILNPEMIQALAGMSPELSKFLEENPNATSYTVGAGTSFATSTPITEAQRQAVAAVSYAKEYVGPSTGKEDKPEDTNAGGGGGSKEKSFLEQTIEELDANASLYLTTERAAKKYGKNKASFFGVFQELRKKFGVPEGFIRSLGTGLEGLKKAVEFLDASKQKRKEIIAKFKAVSVGEAIEDLRRKREDRKAGIKAANILTSAGLGITAEQAKAVAEDSDLAYQIIAAAAEGNKKKLKKLLNLIKTEIIDQTDTENPLEKQMDDALDIFNKTKNLIDQGFDELEEKTKSEMAAEFASKNGKTVSEMERQVVLNQRLIDQEQDKIDKKQEQINDYQRENDLIQQGIDDLRRNDELRNRVSSALSYDLEKMSIAEQGIRDAYDEKIKSLEKVESINQRIIEQQRGQLNLARSLSEGDIYAATQAAQEMRATDLQFAMQNTKDALQVGMENQINALVSSEGKTRKQIEDEISSIKEQSYQASLMIRVEEDKIYANNLLVRDLTNQIYDINENMIEPLQNINKEYERALSYHAQEEEFTVRGLKIAGMTREEWNKKAKALEDNITNARDLDPWLQALIKDYDNLAAAATAAATEAAKVGGQLNTGSNLAPSYISSAATALTPASITSNTAQAGYNYMTQMPMYAGGLAKYATGGIAGDGSRDSIPSMLTPGEFIIRKAMVDKYGIPMLSAINQGSFAMPRFNIGQNKETNIPELETSNTNIVAPMYNNYSVNVSVSNSGASADEIANKTLMKIKQLQNTQIRSGRGY